MGGVSLGKGKAMPSHDGLHFDLALAPYSGGHYRDNEMCVPFSILPDGRPSGLPSGDGCIDPPNTGGASSSWEVANPQVLTQEQNWWPVVTITSTTLVRCGGTVIVVVCVYQWMWDQPTGWRIRVTELRSRL